VGARVVCEDGGFACGRGFRLLAGFFRAGFAGGFSGDEFAIDPAAKGEFWKDEKVPGLLGKLADAAGRRWPEWESRCVRPTPARARLGGRKAAWKAGLLINATRVAIVGAGGLAPPLFDTMVATGAGNEWCGAAWRAGVGGVEVEGGC